MRLRSRLRSAACCSAPATALLLALAHCSLLHACSTLCGCVRGQSLAALGLLCAAEEAAAGGAGALCGLAWLERQLWTIGCKHRERGREDAVEQSTPRCGNCCRCMLRACGVAEKLTSLRCVLDRSPPDRLASLRHPKHHHTTLKEAPNILNKP